MIDLKTSSMTLTLFLWHSTRSKNVAEAGASFNEAIADYPETTTSLSPDSNIFLQPVFETAITKLQNGQVSDLTLEELRATILLRAVSQPIQETKENEHVTLSER